MGKLRVLNSGGHTELDWKPEVAEEVSLASQLFEKARAEGMTVIERRPDEDVIVETFDPQAEQLVAVPQIAGG